ncbi:MAG: hypothetical protein HY692_09140 [Cyanobacteria bacterium NC_groundwater_1444_Ag_S-0.65um_54_12]|nr:hypothetical protein [Cyanobacteria bacterium NC_groundwater_1444_Ag_S-0.65um_54_12]
MAATYLVEIRDETRIGKLLLPLQKAEVQQPALEFVFSILGAEDPAALVAERNLTPGDAKWLEQLQKFIFVHDGGELVIRDNISFEANQTLLDPDAQLEEYFLPRQRPGGREVLFCEIAVLSNEPAQAQRRQMRAYQIMFILHQFKRGYQTTAADVDVLRELTEEAEEKGLLRFDLSKNTFVIEPAGQRAYESLLAEAAELLRRYDIFADTDVGRDGTIYFDTGQGNDLRVPIYELAGINPFRARFILGIHDGEWDDLANWAQQITATAWFEAIFADIETAPGMADIGRDLLEQIFDEGKAALRESLGQAEDF